MAVALPETYGSSQNSGIDFSLCSLRTARKSNRRKIARSLFINYWQCAEQKCLTMRLSWPVLTRAYAVTKLMAEWQPFKFPVKSLSLKLRSSSDPVRRSEAWCRVSGWQLRRGFRTKNIRPSCRGGLKWGTKCIHTGWKQRWRNGRKQLRKIKVHEEHRPCNRCPSPIWVSSAVS